MLFELSHHLDDCASLALRQELDLLVQLNDQIVKPSVSDKNSYFTDLFGN